MKIVHSCFFVLVSVTLMFSQDINQAEVKVLEGFVPVIPESEKIKERMFDIEHDVWHF